MNAQCGLVSPAECSQSYKADDTGLDPEAVTLTVISIQSQESV